MPETLAPTALCTVDDVRAYLGIKTPDLSAEDTDVLTRLVNAASETWTDESQRIWKVDPVDTNKTRLYRLDSFDLQVGRLRIDDCKTINSVGYGDYRSPLGPSSVSTDSWYAWQDEPGQPIIAIVFAEGLAFTTGNVIAVDAEWGWPRIPEKVRQSV